VLRAEIEVQEDLLDPIGEERLAPEASGLGICLTKLSEKNSTPDKVRLAAALRASTSVSNGWPANRLNMGKAATVSRGVRRYKFEKDTGSSSIISLSRINLGLHFRMTHLREDDPLT